MPLVRCYESSIHWELDGLTVDEAVKWLTEQQENLRASFPDAEKISLSYEDDPYEDYYNFNIVVYRPENEKERKAREAKEAQFQERMRQNELKQLQRLKKKFPDA